LRDSWADNTSLMLPTGMGGY